ncbi:MAG: rRNA pseudouridine synthase [Cytophagaceae bacterium]|jgi:23S rRNA pseudouridine2605 synthase|nr:rRNA pseudouridine synthase [Cytophagaceae bacterium]
MEKNNKPRFDRKEREHTEKRNYGRKQENVRSYNRERKYDEKAPPPKATIRLNRYISNAGICSRREADKIIETGDITVNGKVVKELGTQVSLNDDVRYKGKRLNPEAKVYVLLNKPKNCVTTAHDPEGRLTVLNIVENACEERIYPVGRLDRQTTGLLLLTNDGDLSKKLTHPSSKTKKIYHIFTDTPVKREHIKQIAEGINLEDGFIQADQISYVDDDEMQVGIEIHSGRNRVVRRIFEHFGYKIIKLDRVFFAGLTKKNLPRGKWRHLTPQEVTFLKAGILR